jgi:phage tail protein X
MAETLIYTTKEGQRWDNIAHEVYGRADLFPALIEANSDVPFFDVFPGGIELTVPVLESVDIKIDSELLPPWKR